MSFLEKSKNKQSAMMKLSKIDITDLFSKQHWVSLNSRSEFLIYRVKQNVPRQFRILWDDNLLNPVGK